MCKHIGSFVGIRRLTARLFQEWTGTPGATFHYLPNCVETAGFGVGSRRQDLIAKYGLAGRLVVMTSGRIESDRYEPRKGFDEVLETLPLLAPDLPNITYLVVGDGEGRPRLEAKARALGVADRVVFTGYVDHDDKADHFRLADVVAMPGSSPSFDRYPFRFGFLEPLACGVPVVGSRLVDESERDDPDAQRLLIQVDPNNTSDIKRGILEGLDRRRPEINPALAKFSYEAFAHKARVIVDTVTAPTAPRRRR